MLAVPCLFGNARVLPVHVVWHVLFAVLLEANIATIIYIIAICSGHMGLTSLIIANDLRVSTCGQIVNGSWTGIQFTNMFKMNYC